MMKKYHATKKITQTGFSLIELLVGLIIGLLTTLVIMQVFSAFEGQKRTTSGTTDAQTNGSIGLYSLQRDVQLAGFGLPLFDAGNMPLNCTTQTFSLPAAAAPPTALPALNVNLSPISISNGATATASDSITVRYGTSASAGIPMRVTANGTSTNTIALDNNIGCAVGDVAFAVHGTTCNAVRVRALGATTSVTVAPAIDVFVDDVPSLSTRLSCAGVWNDVTYAISGTQLTKNNVPVVDGIVNMQAQYGISSVATQNQITQWVNATGSWATPTAADRNRIKAVRIAIVARNGLLEKTSLHAVSTACSSITAANPTGVCAWDATSASPTVASPAPTVNLTNTPNWDYYRYKVYESVIPLRNVIWTRERL
jgi:type IV pilus assembly protein PilW